MYPPDFGLPKMWQKKKWRFASRCSEKQNADFVLVKLIYNGFGVLPKALVLGMGRRRDRSHLRGEAPPEKGCEPSADRPLSPDVGVQNVLDLYKKLRFASRCSEKQNAKFVMH